MTPEEPAAPVVTDPAAPVAPDAPAAPADPAAADSTVEVAEEPAAPVAPEEAMPVHSGVSNASPVLPPSAHAAAARAHTALSHIGRIVDAAKADIERWVPAEILTAAEADATALVRSLI